MNLTQVTDFLCPACGSDVGLRSDGISCRRSGHFFPVSDGIIDFRLGETGDDVSPIPVGELRKLNSEYSQDRWSETVRQLLSVSQESAKLISDLVDDGRYAWKVFLEFAPEMKMLELGCGFGNLSENLAPHVGKTYALDLTFEQLTFAKHRFETFNKGDDIALVAASPGLRLPFRDASVDIVILSDFVEWTSRWASNDDPQGHQGKRIGQSLISSTRRLNSRQIQLVFLKEVRRVLKDDGQLFLGAENRFSYENFGGQTGFHLLRRSLPNFGSSMRQGPPDRAHTYSLTGYRRLIREAGIQSPKFLGLYPGNKIVREVAPARGSFSFWAPAKIRGLKLRVKRFPNFSPAFGIISSSRKQPWEGLISDILNHVTVELGNASESIRVTKFQVSAKSKMVVHARRGDRAIFVKLPLNPAAIEAEQNNHDTLKWLERNRRLICEQVPQPLLDGNISQQTFFVETAVHGVPLAQRAREDNDDLALLRAGLEFLQKLNPVDTPGPKALSEIEYDELIAARLERLKEVISSAQVKQFEALFRRRLENAELPHGLVHGDYSLSNVLVSGGEVSGVLDWEESTTLGIPAIDAVCLLFGRVRSRTPERSIADQFMGFALRQDPYRDLLRLMDQYYESNGTKSDLHTIIVLLYWLQAVDHRLRFGMIYDKHEISTYIERVVAGLIAYSSTN